MLDNTLKNEMTDSARGAAKKPGIGSVGAQWVFRYGMVLALIALIVVTAILDPSFLQTNNLLNLLRQWAPPGLMAVGGWAQTGEQESEYQLR